VSQLILDQALVTARPEHIASELEGEAIILQIESGLYYGLNPIGSRIWELIQVPTTVERLRQQLLQEYDVQPEVCDRDLRHLLQDLQSKGLIEITHEASA
jgi:hypothetical protein